MVRFCMHPSSKLPVNARDVIENAGYEYKTQFHSKGEAKKTGVRSVSSICGSVKESPVRRGHFLPLPSIDSALRPRHGRAGGHKKCSSNSHCVVLWRVANYRNIVRDSEWSGDSGEAAAVTFLSVSTHCKLA